ncbi:13162_t:CDS:2 [Racocetra persica]|uniref:13162_t:CDS:1 n=1 Tax=Racocetra persica TaxID=160502 RepID=A0ACA9PUB3_9GLOM|nr:13162_t:CDS:2 [Racocetra persica]
MTNISKKTRLTHFMFTIYTDNFQKYKELINENTQLRLGNYKYNKKASTIKSIFQDEEMHIDYHNGTFEDMIRYCKKDHNRCSKYHPYCRCDFFDLTKICDKCNESCLEFCTFACVDDNSGPFEYGKLTTNNNAENTPYFGRDNFQIENKNKYSSIYNQFDYIIEYKKFRNDDTRSCIFECICCSVKRIFHKGSYENFINLRFEIEFNSNVTFKQIAYIVREDNLIEEYNKIKYYNHDFKSQVDKFELTDHRIENDLYVDMIVYLEVKRKLENRLCGTKRKRIRFKGFKENKIDYVIEKSDENYDSDISMSLLSSNDSETTKCRKKEKAVCKEH